MYKQFLTKYLSTAELKNMNKNSKDDIKYCNGLCQDLISNTLFSRSKMICRSCMNTINLAKKQIEDQKITLKQFKENPKIVYKNEEIKINIKKICKTCKQEKSITDFQAGRRECKSCRYIKPSKKNNNIDEYLKEIKKIENDLTKLESLAKNIQKDSLIVIISKFGVGRKSTDTKEEMIEKFLLHFKKILNPFICRGCCGNILQNEFDICEKCNLSRTKTKRSILTFEKNILPSIIEKLEPIILEDNLYSNDELKLIAKTLDVKLKSVDKKSVIVEKINKKVEIDKKTKNPPEIKDKKKFNIKDITRMNDGYINATTLCKACNKKFKEWNRLKQSKEIVIHLSEELNIPIQCTNPNINENFRNIVLVVIINNGPINKRGTWVHPDVAIAIACWISPKFFSKVCRWVGEWKKTSKTNLEIFEKELETIEGSFVDQQEREIRDQMAEMLNGEIEVENIFGFIDIVTETEIIEIKKGNCWKHGLGQLLAYSADIKMKNKQKRLHLFDIKDLDLVSIEKILKKYDVKLTF